MIPEGLVLLTSIAFTAGVLRLSRRRVLVQELAAIEGLARVDVVCTDKTGTITELDLEVSELVPLDGVDRAEVEAALGALAAADPEPNASGRALAHAFAARLGPDVAGGVLVGPPLLGRRLRPPRRLDHRRPQRAAGRGRRPRRRRRRRGRLRGGVGAATNDAAPQDSDGADRNEGGDGGRGGDRGGHDGRGRAARRSGWSTSSRAGDGAGGFARGSRGRAPRPPASRWASSPSRSGCGPTPARRSTTRLAGRDPEGHVGRRPPHGRRGGGPRRHCGCWDRA